MTKKQKILIPVIIFVALLVGIGSTVTYFKVRQKGTDSINIAKQMFTNEFGQQSPTDVQIANVKTSYEATWSDGKNQHFSVYFQGVNIWVDLLSIPLSTTSK